MNFQQAIAAGFRNYVNFSMRASRSEYWFWALFAFIVGSVAAILDLILFLTIEIFPLNTLMNLVLFLPSLGLAVRRLHDLDRTG